MKKPLALVGVWLSGCALLPTSPPTRYYLLPDPPPCLEKRFQTTGPPLVVEEVEIPAYLDRPYLLTVDRDGRIELDTFHRLAEPIDLALQRLLVLTLRTAFDRPVMLAPAKASKGARTLQVQVLKFHIEENERAVLEALWRLGRGPWQETAIAVQVEEQNVPGKLKALSRAVGRFACQLAGKILP